MSENMSAFGITVAAVVVGVMAAGYAMSKLRGSIGLVNEAHSGFDS